MLTHIEASVLSGLFIHLYSAVERLLVYQDAAHSSKAAVRCILLHELCPALHTLLEDGLKVCVDRVSYQQSVQMAESIQVLAWTGFFVILY